MSGGRSTEIYNLILKFTSVLQHLDNWSNLRNFSPVNMEVMEEDEPNILREIASDDELTQIPRELVKKVKSHFNAKCDELITAKAVFESSRKNLGELGLDLNFCQLNLSVKILFFRILYISYYSSLKVHVSVCLCLELKFRFFISFVEQNLEKTQKQFAEQQLEFDECKRKFDIMEKYSVELCSNLEEGKNEIHKLKESVKRYSICIREMCYFNLKMKVFICVKSKVFYERIF